MILSNLTPCFSANPIASSSASAVVAWSRCTAIGTLAAWALMGERGRRHGDQRASTHSSTQKRRYGSPPYSSEMGKSWRIAGDFARSAARTSPMALCAS